MRRMVANVFVMIVVIFTGVLPMNAVTVTFNVSGTVPYSIPDNSAAGVTRTFTVSGIPSGVTINDVYLTLDISHTWIGDLRSTLTSPDSEVHTMFYDIGDTNSPANAGDSSNLLGVYIMADTGATTLWTAALGGTSSYNIPAGTYRTTNINVNSATSILTTFGYPGPPLANYFFDKKQEKGLSSVAPEATNGTWSFYISDNAAGDTGTVNQAQLTIVYTVTTAANASISGKLLSPSGRGLSNAIVTIRDAATGEAKSVRSTTFGFFSFRDLPVGQTYVIEVSSKKYRFIPQAVTLSEDVSGLILQAQ